MDNKAKMTREEYLIALKIGKLCLTPTPSYLPAAVMLPEFAGVMPQLAGADPEVFHDIITNAKIDAYISRCMDRFTHTARQVMIGGESHLPVPSPEPVVMRKRQRYSLRELLADHPLLVERLKYEQWTRRSAIADEEPAAPLPRQPLNFAERQEQDLHNRLLLKRYQEMTAVEKRSLPLALRINRIAIAYPLHYYVSVDAFRIGTAAMLAKFPVWNSKAGGLTGLRDPCRKDARHANLISFRHGKWGVGYSPSQAVILITERGWQIIDPRDTDWQQGLHPAMTGTRAHVHLLMGAQSDVRSATARAMDYAETIKKIAPRLLPKMEEHNWYENVRVFWVEHLPRDYDAVKVVKSTKVRYTVAVLSDGRKLLREIPCKLLVNDAIQTCKVFQGKRGSYMANYENGMEKSATVIKETVDKFAGDVTKRRRKRQKKRSKLIKFRDKLVKKVRMGELYGVTSADDDWTPEDGPVGAGGNVFLIRRDAPFLRRGSVPKTMGREDRHKGYWAPQTTEAHEAAATRNVMQAAGNAAMGVLDNTTTRLTVTRSRFGKVVKVKGASEFDEPGTRVEVEELESKPVDSSNSEQENWHNKLPHLTELDVETKATYRRSMPETNLEPTTGHPLPGVEWQKQFKPLRVGAHPTIGDRALAEYTMQEQRRSKRMSSMLYPKVRHADDDETLDEAEGKGLKGAELGWNQRESEHQLT